MGALGAALFAHDHVVAGRAPTRPRSRGDASMTVTAGIDVGSTYTKVVIHDGRPSSAKTMSPTEFRLREIAAETFDRAIDESGMGRDDVAYVIATGIGRHSGRLQGHPRHRSHRQQPRPAGSSRGRTILDIGGQTMKATRVGRARSGWQSFRLNDKCAAGTRAFSRRRPGTWATPPREIGPLMSTSKGSHASSPGVCRLRRIGGDQPPLPGAPPRQKSCRVRSNLSPPARCG